jgi:hypothetical protein
MFKCLSKIPREEVKEFKVGTIIWSLSLKVLKSYWNCMPFSVDPNYFIFIVYSNHIIKLTQMKWTQKLILLYRLHPVVYKILDYLCYNCQQNTF